MMTVHVPAPSRSGPPGSGALALLLFLLLGLALGLAPRPARAGAKQERALQLASFDLAWSRIGQTYPDPDMGGLDWAAVRDELRPRAARARTAAGLRPILQDMIGRFGVSHFAVIPSDVAITLPRVGGPPGDGEVGLDVRLVAGQVWVTWLDPAGPAAAAGLGLGWQLVRVGDVTMDALLQALAGLEDDPRLIGLLVQRAVGACLAGAPGSALEVEARDGDGQARLLQIPRVATDAVWATLGSLPPEQIHSRWSILEEEGDLQLGLFAFDAFMAPAPARFTEAMLRFLAAPVQGVILDLRGNSGGVAPLAMGMAGHLLATPGQSLGTLRYRENTLNLVVSPRPAAQRFDGPVAVLVDSLSISSAEIMAAGLQKLGRARVFGEVSAGMALPSTWEQLPNGDLLQYVTADFIDPAGQRIEAVGVVPDEVVPLDRASLLAGHDPQLDAAVRWLRAQRPERSAPEE